MASSASRVRRAGWGATPWRIDFKPEKRPVPAEADVVIVGGGFTGLAAAAWLRRLAPEKSVVLLERGAVGSGASGHTGGTVLAETAAGDLPGLGDVIAGFSSSLRTLGVECDLVLPGAWEIGRRRGLTSSPIAWEDSGTLRVVNEVEGGTLDPGKVVSGLARAAEQLGAILCESAGVEDISFGEPLVLQLPRGTIRASQVLFATNAFSLEMNALAGRALPMFTLATATEPLSETQLREIGLVERKAFYTLDLPYLWGRAMPDGGVLFGGGLVHPEDWRELDALDIRTGDAAQLFTSLEARIHGLHPALADTKITHRWGGPILFAPAWRPVFSRHPRSQNAFVLGAYSGHGVALSVYLGCWAAEVLLGMKEVPDWGAIK